MLHLTNRLCFVLLCLSFGHLPAVSADCSPDAAISLQVLGSGGPEMDDRRASSGYLVWRGEKAVVLVDAGSGTALNFEQSKADINHLKAVLFTHFHVDHSVDFPSLVKASYFTGREANLPVFGPAGNELMPAATEYIASLLGEDGAYRYLKGYVDASVNEGYQITVTDVSLNPRKVQRYRLDPGISLSTVPVHHGPLPAVAWRIDIDGCSISFSGDMSNRFNTLSGLANNSDLLVAGNAIPEGASGAARSLHMPPSEIGKIAATAKVKQLVLSHRMLRTLGRELQTKSEIRKHFAGQLLFADDLDRVVVGHQSTKPEEMSGRSSR
jgi:ribonuclease BN (tRNA processing enzyme)